MTVATHVGPVIFAEERPRNQLVERGRVYTVRGRERTTGDTWWRESRTGRKRGDCHIEFVEWFDALELENFEQFVDESGFASARQWQDAGYRQHGSLGILPLYLVTDGHGGGR